MVVVVVGTELGCKTGKKGRRPQHAALRLGDGRGKRGTTREADDHVYLPSLPAQKKTAPLAKPLPCLARRLRYILSW